MTFIVPPHQFVDCSVKRINVCVRTAIIKRRVEGDEEHLFHIRVFIDQIAHMLFYEKRPMFAGSFHC